MAHILAIEDDPVSRTLLHRILEKDGHQFHSFEDVAGAWAYLEAEVMVDVVIVDVQLRKESGLSFLQRLRKHLIFRRCPTIVCSNHNERNIVLKALELGTHAYLLKPYRADALRRAVRKALLAERFADLFGNPASVCERLDLTPSEYQSSLYEAAGEMDNAYAWLTQYLADKRWEEEADDLIDGLRSLASNLEFKPLREVCDILAATQDPEQLTAELRNLPILARLVRERAEHPLPSHYGEDDDESDGWLPR